MLLHKVFFRISAVLAASGAEQQEALQGQHRESTLLQGGEKQCSDYTGDVSASSVYSISPTNPLPKSDLSGDGQIIQLSEVSGMVIVSQPLCSLISQSFLSELLRTLKHTPPLCRALEVSQILSSALLGGKKKEK